MSQWNYPLSEAMGKTMYPMSVPKEWLKAHEALQAVQPKKSEENSTINNPALNSEQSMNLNYYPFQMAQTTMYSYPSLSSYAPNYYGGYNPYLMNNYYYAMPTTSQATSTNLINSSSNDVTTAKLAESNKEDPSVDQAASILSKPPPPPPPPTSPPTNTTQNFVSKQAPGAGGIKFNLPKRKQNNFQAKIDKIQNRLKNFRHFNQEDYRDSNDSFTSNKTNLTQPNKNQHLGSEDMPESVNRYATRCFTKCKTKIDKDLIEIHLKGKLTKAAEDGSIWTKDWDNEPLPRIHSEEVELKQTQIADQVKNSQNSIKNSFISKNKINTFRSQSRSRSKSRSHSRSRSRSPHRRIIKKKRYSRSSSSESSDDSRGSRKQVLSSRIVGQSEIRVSRNFNNQKNKKKKKKPNKTSFTIDPEYSTNEKLQKRAARFELTKGKNKPTNNLLFTITNSNFTEDIGGDIEWGSDAVIGTCQEVEKPFLRLTGAVDPLTVRPESVLVKSLAMVKEHWIKHQDYFFACEQLKSIRQDLVVQCIRNHFTIQVYETHARIALEKGDHTEFNQCQSQLKCLYDEIKEGNRLEFTGYHILYTIYTESNLEMKNILCSLTVEEKKDEVVSHALKLSKAWSSNNFNKFFKLYITAPKMSGFIIDWFIERIRKLALKAYVKSYRPDLPVTFLEKALAFPSTEECLAFLTKANLIIDGGYINCKESMGPLANF